MNSHGIHTLDSVLRILKINTSCLRSAEMLAPAAKLASFSPGLLSFRN